ncbi:amino acid ABC transporter ATP-binding protein [Mycobacterium sp. AMU20-3851]|uniref:amino acid ABC transporter ATP-binding protein n=1 Tax=Mycobacterium sp. AMU20-3851 TaxID=3122055 RepID=UPI003754E5C1
MTTTMNTIETPREHYSTTAIRVRKLTKTFGDNHVLRGVDLDITKAQVVTILGKSGSGKSTLLRCLNLLEAPTSGLIEVHGNPIFDNGTLKRRRDMAKYRREMGMLFQNFNIFPHLTVAENVAMPMISGGHVPEKQAYTRTLELLDEVGLRDKALALPKTLSGGQQQRVAIARALGSQPDILLFDEPTSALDPESTNDVLRMIKRISHTGMTMVIVTHELQFAEDISDVVIFMADGVIAEQGPPHHTMRNPQHPAAQAFFKEHRARASR